MKMTWVLPVLVGLVVSVIAGSLLVPQAIKGLERADALKAHSARTDGIVVSVNPANHAQCTYDFTYGNKHYRSSGLGCADRTVGSKISVYFVPNDPTISTYDTPIISDPGSLIFIFISVVGIPAFLAFGIYHRLRKSAIR